MTMTIDVSSKARNEMIDITGKVRQVVKSAGIKDGVCYIFVPHTTAGIAINEGADPDVKRDIINALEKIFPERGDYRHAEGNSDAHIKATLTGNSSAVVIEGGDLLLGTWQAIFFCEYDGPRNRKVLIKILK
jgi:secondary thiamine-phosphate synthase enzyme